MRISILFKNQYVFCGILIMYNVEEPEHIHNVRIYNDVSAVRLENVSRLST